MDSSTKKAVCVFLIALIPALPLRVIVELASAGHETVDVSTITVDRVKQLLDTGEKILLIDLRPNKEFAQRRIPGSRSIPMTELHLRLAEVPKSGRVIFYAADPQNEILDQVFQFMDENGYRNVAMMVEGLHGWVKRKYPLETGTKK